MYMRNRYYNPTTGTFTQEDPIRLAGGLNSYGFANGDPATFSDPYGLSSEECCRSFSNGGGRRRSGRKPSGWKVAMSPHPASRKCCTRPERICESVSAE